MKRRDFLRGATAAFFTPNLIVPKRRLWTPAAFCGVNAPVQPSPNAPPQAVAVGYTNTLFSDEFDSLSLNTAGPNAGGAYLWGNNLWYQAPQPASTFSVSGSILTIKPGGGSMTTHKGFTALAGYFECSMMYDPAGYTNGGPGMAFWLESEAHANGTELTFGGVKEFMEDDCFEFYGSNEFTGTFHDWINGGNTQSSNNQNTISPSVDYTKFHKYGILQHPGPSQASAGYIEWYFDDVLQHRLDWNAAGVYTPSVPGASTHNIGNLDPQFIVLTNQFFNTNLYVDYVRVFGP